MSTSASTIQAKVGDAVRIDTWGVGAAELIASDWDAAPLRVRTYQPVIESLAVRIEITGRKRHYTGYGSPDKVRCRVVFVGDCEPDEVTFGWLYLHHERQ